MASVCAGTNPVRGAARTGHGCVVVVLPRSRLAPLLQEAVGCGVATVGAAQAATAGCPIASERIPGVALRGRGMVASWLCWRGRGLRRSYRKHGLRSSDCRSGASRDRGVSDCAGRIAGVVLRGQVRVASWLCWRGRGLRRSYRKHGLRRSDCRSGASRDRGVSACVGTNPGRGAARAGPGCVVVVLPRSRLAPLLHGLGKRKRRGIGRAFFVRSAAAVSGSARPASARARTAPAARRRTAPGRGRP